MNTFAGMMSVFFWSGTIPLSRSLTEKLGAFNTAGLACLIGGSLPVLYYMAFHRSQFRTLLRLSPRYLWLCGGTFILYMVSLYVAIGMAANRQQIVEVGLINYLWPTFILVFSIPILKNRASPWLALGILISLSGIVMADASMNKEDFTLHNMLNNIGNNFLPYVFALSAAITWSIYSNLARLYAGLSNKLMVPLLLIASGIILEILSVCFREKAVWDLTTSIELLILAIFPCVLAYIFWDIAMRKGNVILVTSFSYLTPLFSVILTGFYLGVTLVNGVWIACALVISGAVICNYSMKKKI